MARPLRFEYPGAVYHVMARGDGGKAIFEDDRDRSDFVARLGKACGSHGWRMNISSLVMGLAILCLGSCSADSQQANRAPFKLNEVDGDSLDRLVF